MHYSSAWVFGGSAHAFLINIHEHLCPSGPYCWKYETFFRLVRNLGISTTDLGFFSAESTPEERLKVEEALKRNIDAGNPCSLLNMENQLISGYDDTHFIVQQPWPEVDLPITPKTLTFKTWKEMKNEIHISLFTFAKTEKADDATIIRDSLSSAVDIAKNPDRWRLKHYHTGLKAYDAWIQAVKDNFGPSHGNWWNGMVWHECREMASAYFAEIASKYPGDISAKAKELSRQYENVAQLLNKAKEKDLADAKKIERLQGAQEAEELCIIGIEEFLRIFG